MLGASMPVNDRFLQELEKSLGSRDEFQGIWPILARISRESPNILPLLNFIPPAWWTRRDLLQDKVLRAASPVLKNCSPAGLRWLRRAPAEMLDSFHYYLRKYKHEQSDIPGEVAEVMADLPPWAADQFELAETVMYCSLVLLKNIRAGLPNCAPARAKRLLRLLARHITDKWEYGEQLFRKAMTQAIEEEVVPIIDWLRAEGHRLPDKNSTWSSLKRRSDKWHEGFRRATLLEKLRWALGGNENSAWESLLGETVIDGLKITPLITGMDLYNESLAMRHCVITYAPRCLYEGWRIFSLQEADGARSTLSLRLQNNSYVIDQHKGPENRPVSLDAAQAAREVCRLYNRKCREATETAVKGAAA